MKQKLLTTFLLLAAVLLGHAQVVTQQQAQQKAMSFMQEQDMPVRKGITAAPLSFTKTGKAPFYVFNITEGKGFVIVSADERTEEILGYSMDSQFEESRLSEIMRIWLREYANQIEALQDGRMTTKPLHVGTHDAIGKLVTTAWGQGDDTETGDAFNQLCPTINGNHCVTGCGATALAQVMRYHEWPKSNTEVIPGYTPNETIGWLSSLSRIKFSWNNMLDRYDEMELGNLSTTLAEALGISNSLSSGSGLMDADGVVYQDYALTFSYSSGTVGTRGAEVTADGAKSGYKPVSATIIAGNTYYSSYVARVADNGTITLSAYRATTSARTNDTVNVRVTYLKQ